MNIILFSIKCVSFWMLKNKFIFPKIRKVYYGIRLLSILETGKFNYVQGKMRAMLISKFSNLYERVTFSH